MKLRKAFTAPLLLILIMITLSLPSCRRRHQADVEFEQFNVALNNGDIEDYTLTGLPDARPEEEKRLKSIPPKIAIPDHMPVLQTINMNIDSDAPDEQIILVKEGSDINARFKILIADYLQIFEYYALTSENITQATNVQSFQATPMDVIGDHNLEIVCTGYNKNNGQTIDIFKYDPASVSSGLKFINILSLSSAGSLELIHDKPGASYPVERQQEDMTPGSDIITKEIYTWSPDATGKSRIGSYRLSFQETLRKARVSDAKLRKIIQSPSKEARLNYLTGQWKLEAGSKSGVYLFFDFKDQTFSIYTDHSGLDGESNMENYYYLKYHRLLYNKIRLEGVNELHDFKKVRFYITYLTMDRMKVEVYDNDSSRARLKPNSSRSGYFSRISEEDLEGLALNRSEPEQKLPSISGIYNERPGKQYIFEYPFYKIKNKNNDIIQGGYAIYMADVPIMEMQTFDERGVVRSRQCYRFSYNESRTGRKLFRTITLIPGKLTVHGFEETSKDPLKLENEEFTVE